MRAKKRSLVLKVFKMLKNKGGGNSMISIPEAVRQVACMMGSVRVPRQDVSEEERYTISEWCVETIHRHICLVNEICKVMKFRIVGVYVCMCVFGLEIISFFIH